MSQVENKSNRMDRVRRTQKRRRKQQQQPKQKKPRLSRSELFVKMNMYKPFIFEDFMFGMKGNDGELFAGLFIQKLKMGYYPSDNVMMDLRDSGNENMVRVREYMNKYHSTKSLCRGMSHFKV